jgi:hypothetical protein
MLNRDEKLARIASDDNESYVNRKKALDAIEDKYLISQLAETVHDEWIRLESAVLSNNREVLKTLINHQDEAIQLESAIELNNQKYLAHIVLHSKDLLHRDIALNYITKKDILRELVTRCIFEKDKVEAALRLRDHDVIKKIIPEIENEELKLRLAETINDLKVIAEISRKANDSRIRQLAGEWVSGFKPESDID